MHSQKENNLKYQGFPFSFFFPLDESKQGHLISASTIMSQYIKDSRTLRRKERSSQTTSKRKKKTKIKCRLSLNPLRANDRNFARNLSSVISPLQPLPPPVLKAKTLLPLRRLRRWFYFSGTCRCEAEMTLFSTRVTGYSSTATFCYIAIFLLFALPPEGSSKPLTIRHFRGGGARASQILGNLLPVAR